MFDSELETVSDRVMIPKCLMLEIKVLADIVSSPWVISINGKPSIDVAKLREFKRQSSLVNALARHLIHQDEEDEPEWADVCAELLFEIEERRASHIADIGDLNARVELLEYFELHHLDMIAPPSLHSMWVTTAAEEFFLSDGGTAMATEEGPDFDRIPEVVRELFTEVVVLLQEEWIVRTDSGRLQIREDTIRTIRAHLQVLWNFHDTFDDPRESSEFDSSFYWLGEKYSQKVSKLIGLNLSPDLMWITSFSGGEALSREAISLSVQTWKSQDCPSIVQIEECDDEDDE
jgi:hypothetical protein